jgi:integrase
MASLRTHKKSKFWFACITGPDGKQKQFSTGLADKGEAMAVAVVAERELRKHNESPHQLRGALDRLAADYTPKTDADPAAWLQAWAAGRRREVAPATAEKYVHTAKQAGDWLTLHGISTFAAITPARLTELRNHWGVSVAASTVALKMKILRGALGAAVKENRMDKNPAELVGALVSKATRRREFRPAELSRLVPMLTGEWRAVFFLGLYTGQRLNDLAELKWRNVDLKAKTISFIAAKTKALVALPLVDEAREALLALPGRNNPDLSMFPKLAATGRGSRSNAFRKLLWKAGLARHPHAAASSGAGQREIGELCFHSLRHTATSMLKAAGVSDSIARAIIGHESAAVSRAYTHLDMATMKAALDKMGKIG